MCVGNEVETLALETVSESGPEVFSAVAIANNNGRVQEGDQHFRRRFPGLRVTSLLDRVASAAALCSGVRTGGREGGTGVRRGFPAGCQSKWRLYLPEQQNACGFLGPSSWRSLPSGGTGRGAVGKNPCIAHAHQT